MASFFFGVKISDNEPGAVGSLMFGVVHCARSMACIVERGSYIGTFVERFGAP